MKEYDIIIVGAGIVGLATAYNLLLQDPSLEMAILEKESAVAQHQTGHNSGVIHSGVYYTPGSAKAKNCKRGYDLLKHFCDEQGIEYEICGKVIVATEEKERPVLHQIFKKGQANGLEGIRMISGEEVKEFEPHVRSVEGIYVPQAGIIDYKDVARKFQSILESKGVEVLLGHKVIKVDSQDKYSLIHTPKGSFRTKMMINCAGLYSDKVASMVQEDLGLAIIPFRGEYYDLKPHRTHLVNNLIYPVPNPDFPFLGVHFTRMIKGGIEAGPNAVLAFRREGYSRWQIHFPELFEILTYSGFHGIVKKYWREGLSEMYRSFSKRSFVNALQKLIPEVGMDDVVRSGAGVRAQACAKDGKLLDDFAIYQEGSNINVCNAPSPAATSCLAIGETIANLILNKKMKSNL